MEAGIVAPVLEPKRHGRPLLAARERRVRVFLIVAVQAAVAAKLAPDTKSARRLVNREARLLSININERQLDKAAFIRDAEKSDQTNRKYVSKLVSPLLLHQFDKGYWGKPDDPKTFKFLVNQAAAAKQSIGRQFGSND